MKNGLALMLSLLFVAGFAFGFAFTTASTAHAGPSSGCCVASWCPNGFEEPLIEGHLVLVGIGEWECVYDGTDPCDHLYECISRP